eukprot:TRINITY_DN15940_c0_g1_i1.p1 TRINITY_DN15940_c0_g1~~TRINITY_DN15940_c0_g1_i1.p1  ORF type:complete len:131 (+),score=70.81 TRINITY_DN15940_c0_g1_i1:41-433(+)
MAAQGTDEAYNAFRRLKIRKTRWVTWKIDGTDIVVDVESDRKQNYKDFLKALPDTAPRYAAYDHEYKTADGRLTGKLYFIAWKPMNSNQTDKIVFAQSLSKFRSQMDGITSYQFDDIDELEELLENEYIK